MAQNTQYPDVLRRVSATPMRCISVARHQNPRGLSALQDLVKVWAHVPRIMELGIIEMFLFHLREELAPSSTREWREDALFAHFSLIALSGMASFFDDPKYDMQARALLAGWPGIVKWSHYNYDFHPNLARQKVNSQQLVFIASIAGLLFAFSRFPAFQPTMVDTPGSIELAAKVWIWGFEGKINLENATICTTVPLNDCLKYRTTQLQGRVDVHDKMLSVVDGDTDFLVRLILRRLGKATKRLDDSVATLTAVALYLELIMLLCGPDMHPLQRGFFDAGGIACVTRAIVAVSRTIPPNPTEYQGNTLTTCISFFSLYLQKDGYAGVVRVMKMGLLQALLDCSPAFPRLPKDTVDMALAIVCDVLPPYAVYQSFFDAVVPFFRDREQEKLLALLSTETTVTPFWCDNIECRRLDTEHTFKICRGCQVVYYCSPECQKADWKAGHRSVCELIKVDSRLGRREQRDQSNIQSLAQTIVHLNSATFHTIAEREFPDTPRNELVPCVDLTRVPEVFSVRTFDDAISERFRPIADWYRSHGSTSIVCTRKDGSEVREMWLRAVGENFWEVKSLNDS
ncbi:hypothetical protein FB45DRAFT_868416 [Roridomyces roridus]|uniref:phytol kinase n=1 Tax=Roridomyces roridus TaxID=1738132 RepID=A0AAD7FLP9_9AGAR|nr:hypothetical protein FB45DRAFT_868416 [Roridomyces roridus]